MGVGVMCGGDWVRGIAAHWAAHSAPLEKRKILIQLCSGFYGFWLGSTPRLASNAAQDEQGGLRVKQIQTDSHQLVLKPHRNLPSQQ